MNFRKVKAFIITNKMGELLENVSFKNITTLRIGGNIRLVYRPNSILNFLIFYKFALEEEIKIFIMGKGSNILASDKTFNGVVVDFSLLPFKYIIVGSDLLVFPYTDLRKLSINLSNSGYKDYEFLAGIPGTIGGGLFGNCGFGGLEIGNLVKKVLCVDETLNYKWYSKEELKFSYRNSLIKENRLIVLSAFLKLSEKDENNIKRSKMIIEEYRKKRISSQPLNALNAGSTFKNSSYPAWKLIDFAGLRGKEIGDAKVSTKHSNFLVNKGKATSQDMMSLIESIKKEVFLKCEIFLECEWVFVNFS